MSVIEARTIDGALFVRVVDVVDQLHDRVAELTPYWPESAAEVSRIADLLTVAALEHVTDRPGDSILGPLRRLRSWWATHDPRHAAD